MRTRTTTKTRKKKRMRRIGRLGPLLLGLILFTGAVAGKEKKQKIETPAAILAGSVFHDTGFVLRGAGITVTPEPQGKKKAEWKAISDGRGEFFLRLPAGPASYNVVVRANGFKEMRKLATYAADERLDFSFLLEPDDRNK